MGNVSSTIVGRKIDGRSIFASQLSHIKDFISKHSDKISEVKEGEQTPSGAIEWGVVEGKKYFTVVPPHLQHIIDIASRNKDKMAETISSKYGFNMQTAKEIVHVVLPVLIVFGSAAAAAALRIAVPEGGEAASLVVLTIGTMAAAYAPELTGPNGLGAQGTGFSNQDLAQTALIGEAAGHHLGNKYTGKGEPGFYHHVSDHAYHAAAEHYGGEMSYSGGCDDDDYAEGGCGCRGGFIGSDELDTTTVRDYSNSLNSKTKNKIIDDILDVGTKLGMKITGDSTQAKIKSMLDQMPTGDRFKQNEAVHKKTCMGIAESINKIYGNTVINKELPPEVICQQVAEIISSLNAGMHSEFLAVYNDVRKVLKNLHILKNALKDDHDAMMDKIKASDDSLLSQQVVSLNDLHKMLTDEIDRQIQMLSNLLNVTLFPTEKDLATLIKHKKGLHGYIEKIDVKVGSDKFGKVISDVLKGLGLTANFALLIERALKTVGITMDEYAKSNSVSKLREKITQNLMGKTLSEEQLHEYLQAAELLYRNFYRNVDIAKKLEGTHSTKTGEYEMDYLGGDDNYPKSVMDKRIADRKKLRNLIFNAFYKQLNDLFDQFVGALDQLTMKVGTEIPLSDQLDGLRYVLQRIDDSLVRKKNIYYALIGYYNDAMSKSKKDTFLGDLRMISSYIDTILEMPLYKASSQHFINVQKYIKGMIDIIDKFSDEIAAKFGRGEDMECQYLEKKEDEEKTGEYEFTDAIYGGIDVMESLEREPEIKYRPQKSIHDAIRQFDYKFRVSQIRRHMNATSKELAHYSEKYEKIIANSIADILERDKKVYEKIRKELDSDKFGDFSSFVVNNAEGFGDKDAVGRQRDAALKFLDSQWEIKKKFWATIEAADTYMRVFTDALIKNPNDIKEIKSMLDEIEVINDWYSDATGNTLAGVFDYFPAMMQGVSLTSVKTDLAAQQVIYPPDEYKNERSDGTHYYKRIADKLATTGAANAPLAYPGNPYLVTLPTLGEKARAQVKKTFTGLAVLKNLLSVFINVGSKFGGEELRKKVFMTPTQMYHNIIDYLQASAFAQGFATGVDDKYSADNALPSAFSNSDKMAIELDVFTGKMDPDNFSTESGATVWNTKTYDSYGIVHLGVTASNNIRVIGDRASAESRNAIEKGIFNRLDSNVGLHTVAGLPPSTPFAVYNPPAPGAVLPFGGPAIPGTPAGVTSITTQNWPGIWNRPAGTASTIYGNDLPDFNNEHRALLFKKRWGVWMRSVIDGLRDKEGFGFTREDEYFVLMMKSIAAKIFTVTGMYDVLDRPMEFNGISPIRMITGGVAEIPKIEENAVALYLRLPLLAQFYRNIFGWDKDDDVPFERYNDLRRRDTNIKISMVPDVDGTFAGLIRLIFRKTKFVDNNAYSDEDIKEIIREVNLIYQRMQAKYPENTVMETIYEFVAEVNRRYGIVSEHERNDYEREFGYRYDYSRSATGATNPVLDRYEESPDTEEIAILPGETDDEIQRPSSAQKLLGETFETSTEKKRPFTITKQHKDLVYKFRCAMDKYFENPDEEYTFNHAIKSTQLKLRKETRDEERFKLISSLIRGVDIYSKVDGMKYILFHETVVSGLNVLSAMHSMLARFKRRIQLIDIKSIEEQIWKFFLSPGTKSFDGLRGQLLSYLVSSGLVEENNPRINDLVNNILGLGEALTCNGGHVDTALGNNFIIKAIDGVKNNNGAVPPAPVIALRWPGGNTFGVVHGTAAHSNFKSKSGHLITTNYAGGNPGLSNDPLGVASGGLASVLAGWSVEDLKAAYNEERRTGVSTDASKVASTFMRFILNREFIMKELLESIFGLGHDFQGLVEVKIDDGKMYLSYTGLKSLIEEMFQHVSYFLDMLRPHIKPEILQKYTNKLTPGSYYWLQEQLMEKIIIGRPAAIAKLEEYGEGMTRIGYMNLDELIQRLNYSYEYLTRQWSIDGQNIAVASNVAGQNTLSTVNDLKKKISRTSYDKIFAEMIFYDASKPQSGIINSLATSEDRYYDDVKMISVGGVKPVDFLHDPYDALHFHGPADDKKIDTRFAARFYQLYSWKKEFTMNRSAMFVFNQLIAKFIQSFYDHVSGKIYAGLLNQFANGSFNRSIADHMYTYPDIVPLMSLKFMGGSDIKVPNTSAVMSGLDDTWAVQVEPFTEVLINYLQYGIKPEHEQDSFTRSKLLDITNPLINNFDNNYLPAVVGVGPGARTGNTTHYLYIRLLSVAMAMVIHNIFVQLDTDGVAGAAGGAGHVDPAVTVAGGANQRYVAAVQDLIGSSVNGGAPPVDYGAARALYTNGNRNRSPTLSEVIYKLNEGNFNDMIAKLQLITSHIDPTTKVATNRNVAILQGDFGLTGGYFAPFIAIGGEWNIPKYNNIRSLFDNMLRLPNTIWRVNRGGAANISANITKWGSIVELAGKLYPFADDAIGRPKEEIKYRAKLFAAITARIAGNWMDINVDEGVDAARVKRWKGAVDAIYNSVTRVGSTYAVPVGAQPKYLIKYDDALSASTDYLSSRTINIPLADSNLLVIARRDKIDGILGENNIEEITPTTDSSKRGVSDKISDLLENQLNFNRRKDPDADHVLFTSLSIVLRNLMTSRNKQNQSFVYLQDNVADIPLYMKEKMRANLPVFRNLFKELITRCEFIKRVMSQREIDLTRNYKCTGENYAAGAGGYKIDLIPKHNPWPYVLQDVTTDSTETKNRYTGVLDSIVRGCMSLISSCEQVLKDIGDDPKYFELFQNSIKDYKSQYGFDPLMPLSSTTVVLKNVNSVDDSYMNLFPVHSLGEDQFKFMYGTRSLLGQPTAQPLLENNPGFAQIVEQFNLLIDTKMQLDKSRADAFLKTYVKMLRYIYELKHIKGLLTPYIMTNHISTEVGTILSPNITKIAPSKPKSTLLHIDGLFTRDDLVMTKYIWSKPKTEREPHPDPATYDNNAYTANSPVILTNRSDISIVSDDQQSKRDNLKVPGKYYPLPTYAIAKSLNDVIKLTESSFRDDKIKELVDYMTEGDRHRNRLDIQNIIDLNIVPINVHALMREIPLANLYNYAYTFDRMIIELYYGLKNDNARKLISELCDKSSMGNLQNITSAKDMLVALLLDPYMKLWNTNADADDGYDVNYYEKYVKSMLVGVPNNGELGRPKFLSDQIYNKVIFGEVYSSRKFYNEMGPSAGLVTNVKVNKMKTIDILGEFMYRLAKNMTLGAPGDRYQGVFNPAQPDSVNRNYFHAIAKYMVDNPYVTYKNLTDLIYNKFLDNTNGKGIVEFKNLRAFANVAGSKLLSSVSALIAKVSTWGILRAITTINKVGYSTDIIKEWANKIVVGTMLLNAFGSVAVATPGNWLGIDNGGGAVPPNQSEAKWRLVDKLLQKGLATVANKFDLSSAIDIEDINGANIMNTYFAGVAPTLKKQDLISLYKLADEILVSDPLPDDIPHGNNAATLITVAAVEDFLLRSLYKGNTAQSLMDGFVPDEESMLHWLDVNYVKESDSDYVPAKGVSLQREPAGDNDNILDHRQVKMADVRAIREVLSVLGRLRFDTILIRNLVFIINLYRSVRMKLQRDLVYSKDIVLKSAPITRVQLTEFYGNQVDHSRQTYKEAYPEMWRRYNY